MDTEPKRDRHIYQLPTQTNTSKNTEIPFPEEIEHLETIKELLSIAFQYSADIVNKRDKEYRESKQYNAEYWHEIDPTEIFQNELYLKDIEQSGIIAVHQRNRLIKLMDSPYFSRIDFKVDGETDIYYIGRFTFSHENTIHIYDWRAPFAGMFYDCELGMAGYDAPIGRIEGELTRKRQFKIRKGKMEFALESSINIRDDILQRELSSTSDEKMKTIISTLQREQNLIIRNEKSNVLIIQGVAGSGKTSIALHRIAYLLYRFKDSLSAKNIVILSPNKVFGDYISNVLPELGEEPIYEMSFEDIANIQLDGTIDFEPDKDPLENNNNLWAERVQFKSTMEFLTLMDHYLQQAINSIFMPTDYTFGCFHAESKWISERFKAYQRFPIKRCLKEIAGDIHDRFETSNIMEEEVPRETTILKALTSMLKIKNTLALYKDFFRTINKSELLVLKENKILEWADVYPFMYFHSFYTGLKDNRFIQHVVIDEMQDYTPVQYRVINILFQCKKTILGDFGQTINQNHSHSIDDIQKLYDGEMLIELNKSYRSSYEIINFAKKILNVSKLEPIERHSDEPQVILCNDTKEELTRIKMLVNSFLNSSNTSLGIIYKTNSLAKKMYNLLCNNFDANLITPESVSFSSGITITSIQMSKGLEFDEVIIPGANYETYHNQYDRNLLYIACTRAMHRLTLLYNGELTPFLNKEVKVLNRVKTLEDSPPNQHKG